MSGGAAIEILLVEDDEADVLLTTKALAKAKVANRVRVVEHGEEALRVLRREGEHKDQPAPDLVLLDLNLPVMDGFETLAEIRKDSTIDHIPVVVLTTSTASRDVIGSYKLKANAFIQKPVGLEGFMEIIQTIDDFWLQAVRLPTRS